MLVVVSLELIGFSSNSCKELLLIESMFGEVTGDYINTYARKNNIAVIAINVAGLVTRYFGVRCFTTESQSGN